MYTKCVNENIVNFKLLFCYRIVSLSLSVYVISISVSISVSTLRKNFEVQRQNFTRESMTGTSTKTPTTVANAAKDFNPNNEIATATLNSKKLEQPIRLAGAATL